MAFNWEQSAFLGYMVEQYERERGNDIFGRPLDDQDWDTDEDEEEAESNLPWWER